ncbi:MAG: cellulase family glycosylhydrolase [Armatimonadetes bacterium]|nr:cellulase family glycosylhydrolase [Armatimonadota bacterium]
MQVVGRNKFQRIGCALAAVLATGAVGLCSAGGQLKGPLVWAPVADFENGRTSGIGGLKAEVTPQAAHSGKYGLRLDFGGSPGEVYHAFNSYLAGISRGMSFWLRVGKPEAATRMRIVFSSLDYKTQFRHEVPLDFAGWKRIQMDPKSFEPTPGETDWPRMGWIYFVLIGPNPVSVDVDDIALLVTTVERVMEPYLTYWNRGGENIKFNRFMQVRFGNAQVFLHRVSGNRMNLATGTRLFINGAEVSEAEVAAGKGKVTVAGTQYELTGKLEEAEAGTLELSLKCEPAAKVTWRLALNPEGLASQRFVMKGRGSALKEHLGSVVAEMEDPKEVVVGTNSKQRLVFDLAGANHAALHREGKGAPWLEVTADQGAFSVRVHPPVPEVYATLTTDHFHNVYDQAERGRIAINANFLNATHEAVQVVFTAHIHDFGGRRIFTTHGRVSLAPSGTALRVFAPRPDRLGFYKLVLEARNLRTGESFRHFMTLGLCKYMPPRVPPPSNAHFGVTFFCRDPRLTELISHVGVHLSRDDFYWYTNEQTPGKMNFDPVDTLVGNAGEYGISIMPIQGHLSVAPEWSRTQEVMEDRWGKCQGINVEAWRNYWSQVAARYKAKVLGWEIANEIYFYGSAQFIADLHRAAYEAIKAQDPRARVVANVVSCDPNTLGYMEDFLRKGGDKGCDVISTHPYMGFTASPEQGRMREHTEECKRILRKYNPALDFWWTEYGWFGEDEFDPNMPGTESDWTPFINTERQQAQYIIRAYLQGMAAGVPRMFYFLNEDSVTRPFQEALLREEGIRPAICALNALCRTLEFTEFYRELKPRQDVEIMVFRSKEKSAAAVWSLTSPERKGLLRVPLRPDDVQVLDFFGNERQFVPQSRPRAKATGLTIPFDGCPTYLVSRKLSAAILAEALSKARLSGVSPLVIGRVFLQPGRLEVEVLNGSGTTERGEVRLLPPVPASWQLKSSVARTNLIAPHGSARATFPLGTTQLPSDRTLLRMQVPGELLIERSYQLMAALRAKRPLEVSSDLERWGEPTVVLEDAKQTMGCKGGVVTPSPFWQGGDDLSVRLWLRWDDRYFYVGAKVRDDVQRLPVTTPAAMWQGDSLQLGFDAAGNARNTGQDGWDTAISASSSDDSEWLTGLLEGKAALVRTTAPGSLLPSEVPGVLYAARREGEVTCYSIAFPWSVLRPAAPETGLTFGFNIIVNDDDGEGREGWIGITPGMGEGKSPRLFRKVVLVD